jgi:hypothetical protein
MRVPALVGDGLWRDEANVYVQLSAPSFAEFFRRVIATEWHPPLFFLLMYCWGKVAGTSEFALKVLPFVFSVATVALVYRLGKAAASFTTGAIGAALYAIAPFAVAYSSEYLYPLSGFLSTLLALLVVRARNRPFTGARFTMLALAALLVVFTHYTALFFIPLLVVWALASGAGGRHRIGVAAALIAGAAPFIFWLPVFIRQRQIGLPYSSAPTAIQKAAFLVRTSAALIPVRPGLLECAFVALLLVALVALVRARVVERDPFVLAAIFVAMLLAVTSANLMTPRYVLPYYGLACVFLGWLLARFGALAVAETAPPRRWGIWAAALLGLVLVAGDAAGAIATSRTPKSGIRSIAHRPVVDAATLYVIAPDYLASTFAYYARDSRANYAGFVRWDQPEVFRLENYAADWNRTDAVDRTLERIAAAPRRYTLLNIVVDDRARDEGQLAYGRIHEMLHRISARYRLLSRTQHAGRYESVSEYRFLRRM